MKSNKVLHNIYANIESLIKKIDGCTNNLENSSGTKISEHTPSRLWHSVYRGEDCMKKKVLIILKRKKCCY